MKTRQLRVTAINGYLGYQKKWYWITDYEKGYNTGKYRFEKSDFSDSVYNPPHWNISYILSENNKDVVSANDLLTALKLMQKEKQHIKRVLYL